MSAHGQVHDGSRPAADEVLDFVEFQPGHRLAVDGQDLVADLDARAIRRRTFNRRDDDRFAARILLDVHADAAEVAAFERLFEAVDLARRQIRRVRIAQRIQHAANRGLGQLGIGGDLSVLRLCELQVAIEQLHVVRFVAGREAERDRGIRDVMVLEVRHQFALFAGEQRLRVDGLVKSFFDLTERVVEHALIRRVRIHQERVQIVEARDARAGLDHDLRRLSGTRVGQVQRAAE